jgi:hypothetical protein
MVNDYAGTRSHAIQKGTELTDAAAAYIKTIDNTEDVGTLYIDVTSDKGCTVDVVTYLDPEQTLEGVPGTQGVVADGGPSGTFKFTDFGYASCKVTVTKTEAGTTSGFGVSIRSKAD